MFFLSVVGYAFVLGYLNERFAMRTLLPILCFAAVALPQALIAGYSQQVVELVNQERWSQAGLPPLKRNALLDQAAQSHSNNMAVRNFFAHCDVDTKTSPWDRMSSAGYGYAAAENIAAGQYDPAAVMNAWMNSPGHRRSILSASHREIGVGYVFQPDDQSNVRWDIGNCTAGSPENGPYRRYWTQNFGSSGASPLVIDRENDETASQDVDLYVYAQGLATEMRFRNESGMWSAWESYSPNAFWTLSGGAGAKTVSVQVRNGSNIRTATDTILLVQGCSEMGGSHHLYVPAMTVHVDRSFRACNTLYAGSGDFRIAAGNVTFNAPRIVLRPGFSVAVDAVFSAVSGVPQ